MRTPPRLGKHQGFMVTSASRAGSQNPTEIPMRGNGSAQAQIGEAGLLVSGRPLGQIFRPPTDRGNRPDQQIGRASCRGRGIPALEIRGVAASLKKKNV